MRVEVYHLTRAAYIGFTFRGRNAKTIFPNEYEKVAVVNAKELESAFRTTNHIDENWTENDEVIWSARREVRSTSVGDVFLADGKAYFVASCGFEEFDFPHVIETLKPEDFRNPVLVGQ